MDQRPGFLVSTKRLQELKTSAPAVSKEEETKVRLQRIREALAEARKLAAEKPPQDFSQARQICEEILDLYHDYPDFRDSTDPDLKQLVAQAQQLADRTSQPEQKR
jgi:hypothetical protein